MSVILKVMGTVVQLAACAVRKIEAVKALLTKGIFITDYVILVAVIVMA